MGSAMKRTWLLGVCLGLFQCAVAQKLEILKKSDQSFPPLATKRGFYPIKAGIPTDDHQLVATIKASGRYLDVRVGKIFEAIERAALPLGATAYRINSYTCDD